MLETPFEFVTAFSRFLHRGWPNIDNNNGRDGIRERESKVWKHSKIVC